MADAKFPPGPVALVALALCCALPVLFVVGGGALASALGLGLRFWSVTIVGAAVVAVGLVSVTRRVRGRAWKEPEPTKRDRLR